MVEDTPVERTAADAPTVDPEQIERALQDLRSEQSLVGGALAGLVSSLIGAAVWAGVTVLTNYHIGWIAVGVGALVGFAVRLGGKGIDNTFGVIGAIFAMLGCALGNLLAICGILAKQEEVPFMEVVAGLDPSIIGELMVATFSPMDLLFYGIALYEGYKLAFRQVSPQDLQAALPPQ